MFTKEDNELLTRTGPGTPMGELMRQYWVPALLSSELAGPDCAPVRIRLLGEDLIAFRDSQGRVGMLGNHCPHRGASLFFGRNEESGLRCVYHGWKYDVTGQCVDMPSEPPESNFKQRVKATAYPCTERGGLVWTYMGPRSEPPPLPNIHANMLPEGEGDAWAAMRECNWLRGMEGEVDTAHFGFLHQITDPDYDPPPGSYEYYMERDRAPKYSIQETEYGTFYGAYRPAEADSYYWRIAQFLMPFFTMIPTGQLGTQIVTRAWVPLDDEHTMFWMLSRPQRGPDGQLLQPLGTTAEFASGAPPLLPNTSDWLGRFRTAGNSENDFLIDRELQRTRSFTGVKGIYMQDQAVTESMGAVYDRSQEHLGSADHMVVRTRLFLLQAVKAFRDQGTVPVTVDHPELYEVRSGGTILPRDVDWLEATAEGRKDPVLVR